jgi:hypothetical protein
LVGQTARRLHPWLAGLFALGVLVQAYLAGAALPQLGGSGNFDTHAFVGYELMGILALLILIAAGLGRADRAQVWGSVALFVDYVVQTSLPGARDSSPVVAALHPVNAIVLFGLAAWLFVRGVRRAPAAS